MVRRWSMATFDLVNQLDHTEEVIDTEHHVRSPATRYYTQPQVVNVYRVAGFSDIRVVRGLSDESANQTDRVFSVFGRRRDLRLSL